MATIMDIGIPGVGTGILQPKLKNRFRVTFTGFGGGSSSIPVSMQVVTCSRPNVSWEKVEVNRYNSKVFVASKHTWEPLEIVIEDDVTGSASKVIQEQLQKQQYLTGVLGPWLASAPEASVYKFATKIEALDGNEAVLETWNVQGCWVQTANYDTFDYSANEAVKITLSVSIDHAYQVHNTYVGVDGHNQGIAIGGA